jgi:hypothetical protein
MILFLSLFREGKETPALWFTIINSLHGIVALVAYVTTVFRPPCWVSTLLSQ